MVFRKEAEPFMKFTYDHNLEGYVILYVPILSLTFFQVAKEVFGTSLAGINRVHNVSLSSSTDMVRGTILW